LRLKGEEVMPDNDNHKTYLPNSKTCFVCGEENHAGLKTRFFVQDGLVKTLFDPQGHHCGYGDVVHGGVVAAILDECMGWAAAREIERMCFTADLTVRYLRPIPARPMLVHGQASRVHRRLVECTGWIADESGQEYARAQGRFTPLTPEQTIAVDDYLLYRGDEERVFDRVRAELDASRGNAG
jgi:uncharacterized protein (TIGR00369 family)